MARSLHPSPSARQRNAALLAKQCIESPRRSRTWAFTAAATLLRVSLDMGRIGKRPVEVFTRTIVVPASTDGLGLAAERLCSPSHHTRSGEPLQPELLASACQNRVCSPSSGARRKEAERAGPRCFRKRGLIICVRTRCSRKQTSAGVRPAPSVVVVAVVARWCQYERCIDGQHRTSSTSRLPPSLPQPPASCWPRTPA